MRKYILAAAVCVAAFLVVPVASASASGLLVGACKFHGTATFTPKLTNVPKEREYKFTSEKGGKLGVEGEGAECTGVNSETQKVETRKGKATVGGKGLLSCGVAAGVLTVTGTVEGNGSLTLGTEPARPFQFNFVAGGGTVVFAAVGAELHAAGAANFLLSENKTPEECLTAPEGVEKLEFEAAAAGTVGPLP